MSRRTGPSARAIRLLSQGDPPARNCSSGEGRADSAGKEQRRQSTQAKNVRCEVECSTVRVPQSEGCSFKHLYGNWSAKFPKNLRKREKNLQIVVRRISISHCARSRPVKYRQTVALNVGFYCSILPIYMNLYGAIWIYLPKEFAHARRFGSL
jgi:hypothetical protein